MTRDEYRILYIWHYLNREVFYGKLKEPKITTIDPSSEDCYGAVYSIQGAEFIDEMFINLDLINTNKRLIEVIAHEMAHQHQFEVQREGKLINRHEGGHGDSFWIFKDRIKEKIGVRLC